MCHASAAAALSVLPVLLKNSRRQHLWAGLMESTPCRAVKDESDESLATPLHAQGPQWRQEVTAALENAEVNYGETLLEEWGCNVARFHEAPCCQYMGPANMGVQ